MKYSSFLLFIFKFIFVRWVVFFWVLIFSFSFSAFTQASPKRISQIRFDKSRVNRLYLYPLRTSLIELPCPIDYALSGNNNDLGLKIGIKQANTIAIWLKHANVGVTNLTVKCDGDILVFDVTPSKKNHQDVLIVKNIFDSKKYGNLKLIEKSFGKKQKKKKKKAKYKKIRLISSSKKTKKRRRR